MERISSNLTLIFKILLPSLWISFFGLFSIALFFRSSESIDLLSTTKFKIIFISCVLLFIAFMYFSVMQLKRLDMDKQFFYVSNYFKTYRYKYIDIEKMTESDFLFFKTLKIRLRQKGKFGQNLIFLLSYKRYEKFIKENPELFAHIFDHPSTLA